MAFAASLRYSSSDILSLTVLERRPITVLLRSAEGDGWICEYDGDGMPPKRQSVRVVPEEALDQFRKLARAGFETTFGQITEQVRQKLVTMSRIAQASKTRDLKKVAKLAWETVSSEIPAPGDDLVKSRYRVASAAVRSPLDAVGAMLNAELGTGRTSVVMWQRESRRDSHLMPALLCSDVTQALFIHALFRLSRKWGLKICPHCKALFSSSQFQGDCCSRRCSLAENSKR